MFEWFIEGLKNYHASKKQLAIVGVLVFLLYTSSIMMFFGMNFWLWSFTKGLKRSYTSILIPSMGWAFLFTILFIIMNVIFRYNGRSENLVFWMTRRGMTLLVLIGIFDSLTGLLCMYSVVHVPVLLQSSLISTGPLLTYILAFALYPESLPSFSPILILVVFCTAAGVTLALIPQIKSDRKNEYFNPAWILIYICGISFFPVYNVLQGRFLNEFRGCGSPFITKIMMLFVETVIQLFFTLVYFPLDAAPFFGKCSSLQESWEMLTASVECIGTCPNNGLYMAVYIIGFWIRHVVFAYLNGYSPTLAAVSSQLTQPINTFFLLIIPSWNIYGAKASWYYTLGCFLFLFLSTFIFVGWHLFYDRQRESELTEVVAYAVESDSETSKA